MLLMTRRSFTRGTPRGLLANIGPMAVHTDAAACPTDVFDHHGCEGAARMGSVSTRASASRPKPQYARAGVWRVHMPSSGREKAKRDRKIMGHQNGFESGNQRLQNLAIEFLAHDDTRG